MAFTKTMLTTALAMATFASSANADTYHHIDGLATKMQVQSKQLLREFALHYSHKAEYRHLRSDAIQFYRVASHIHTVAHHSGDVHHLRDDLQKADRLFHHLEEVLELTDRSFHGHNHGNTNHVFELMHDLETNLHHLKRDVEELDDRAHRTRHSGISYGGRYDSRYGGRYDSRYGGLPSNYSRGTSIQFGNSCVTGRNSGWSFRFGR